MGIPEEGAPRPQIRAVLRSKQFDRFFPIGALILLPALLVLSSIGSGHTLYGSDMILGSFHIRGLVGSLLKEGRLPVWDPHSMCGYPLLAALQAGVLYPLTWPACFLSPGPFWVATVLAHLILAGLFALGWLRRGIGVGAGGGLVGACVFMLSGYLLSHVLGGHISQLCSYPWLAALLWRTERLLVRPTLKRWVLMALTVALLILPGFPQFIFFGAILVAVRLVAYGVRTRRGGIRALACATSAGAAGAIFCAPQFLPTLEMIPEVQRISGISYEFATQFSLPWQNLITFVAPSFFGDDLGIPYWGRGAIWEVTGFVGIGGLILAALALKGNHPQRFFWAAAAAIAVLLSLGSHTPVFKAFYYVMPGARLFRAPGRYLAVCTLALAALSALGFDRWWNNGPDVRRSARRVAIGAALGAGAILMTLILWGSSGLGDSDPWHRIVTSEVRDPESMVSESARTDPDFPEKARSHARVSLVRSSIVFGVLAVCLFGYSRGKITARIGSIVVGTVLVAEMAVFGRGFLQEYDSKLIPWPEDFVQFVKHHPDYPFRLVSPGRKNVSHIGKCQLAGLDNVAGYESMVLQRYCEMINVLNGRPVDAVRIASSVDKPHPVLDMLGAKFWLIPDGWPVPPGWKAIGKVNDGIADSLVLDSPRAFPRAFVVPEAVTIPSRDERLRYLLDRSTDLKRIVVLETEAARLPSTGEAGSGRANVASFEAGEYEITTETAAEGFLVLTESFYPGWEARIDGVPTEILRANHLVQAVRLPAGRHTVRFEYHSRRLRTGFLLSAAIALATLGASARLRRK